MKNIRTKQEILENHKIILIFGAPCSGKSILTYNTFIKGNDVKECRDIMKYTETNNFFLLGSYNHSTARKGLDSLERKQVGNFAPQIENLLKKEKSVVLEGNRCISRPMLSKLNLEDVLMLWIDCDLDELIKRTSTDRELKDDKQLKIIKSTLTMANNFTNDFVGKVTTYYINTSECKCRDDFESKTLFDFEWVWKVTKW